MNASDAWDGLAAVVYDLDGTLVRLRVDWDAVTDDVRAVYRDAGVPAPETDQTLWDLLNAAASHGLSTPVEAAIAAHEREGARGSTRLPTADALADHSIPIGVCSLNCEAACRIALEAHGLLGYIDVIIGRDSVNTHKPDPEPLLAAIRALDATPAEALFIGDSERDAITAEHAGTPFRYVDRHKDA